MFARRESRSRPVMSRHVAFWCVAAAFAVTMLGTTVPTPLYVLYQRELGISTLTTTVVFAAYAAGVLAALLLVGRASDVIGRRRTLLPGLACAALSAVVFLLADDVSLLIVARLLSGLSAGIFTGTATAALVDLSEDTDRATLVATAANMGGLGAGPLLAGLLAQFVPEPLHTPFLLHLALLALVAIGIWTMPEPVAVRDTRELRMARLSVPASVRTVFIRAAGAGFAGFAVLGLVAAIAPLFLRTLLGIPGPAVAGLVVCSLFAASTFGQVVVLKRLGNLAMTVGCESLTLGALTLAAALAIGSLELLIVALGLAGIGQGLTFRSALAMLNVAAPPDRRGEVASSFFIVAYVAISVPVVGAGLAAQAFGLRAAGVGFSLGVAALAGVCAVSSAIAYHRTPTGART